MHGFGSCLSLVVSTCERLVPGVIPTINRPEEHPIDHYKRTQT